MTDWGDADEIEHRMGVQCVLHRTVLVPNFCPRKGCLTRHGFTIGSCTPQCPEYRKQQPKRR